MSGLRASTVLALHALHLLLRKSRPVAPAEIRRSSGCTDKALRGILKKLREAELLRRSTGRGYVLAKAPGEIRILDVVRAVETPQAPEEPCSGDYEACDSRAACILAPLCRKAEAAFQEALREFTLADLADVAVDLPNCLDPRIHTRAS